MKKIGLIFGLFCLVSGLSGSNVDKYGRDTEKCLPKQCVVEPKDAWKELQTAIDHGGEEHFYILLENGLDPMVVNEDGCTLLHFIAKNKVHISFVKLLINRIIENKCEKRIQRIKRYSDLAKDPQIKNEIKEFVDRSDNEGHPAIFYAVMEGHTDLVKFLLIFDPTISQRFFDRNLMHIAAAFNYLDILKLLLQRNLQNLNDVNCIFIDEFDLFNKTALYYALENKNFEMVKLLITHGAKVTQISDIEEIQIVEQFIEKQWFEGLDRYSANEKCRNNEELRELIKFMIANGFEFSLFDEWSFWDDTDSINIGLKTIKSSNDALPRYSDVLSRGDSSTTNLNKRNACMDPSSAPASFWGTDIDTSQKICSGESSVSICNSLISENDTERKELGISCNTCGIDNGRSYDSENSRINSEPEVHGAGGYNNISLKMWNEGC